MVRRKWEKGWADVSRRVPSPLRLSHRGAGVLPVLPLLLNNIADPVKTAILKHFALLSEQGTITLSQTTNSPVSNLLMTQAYFKLARQHTVCYCNNKVRFVPNECIQGRPSFNLMIKGMALIVRLAKLTVSISDKNSFIKW